MDIYLATLENLTMFGWWCEHGDQYQNNDSVVDFIDINWYTKERSKILHYLHHAPVVLASTIMPPSCIFDGRLCTVGLKERYTSYIHSDGVYIWPDMLRHYITFHDIKPSSIMLNHIRSKNYKPPTILLTSSEITSTLMPLLIDSSKLI